MTTCSTVAALMGTGPAPVIVALSNDVGVKVMLSLLTVPLATRVSLPAVGSPPLTVMLVRPVGVLGLLRLKVSLPARPLMVSVVLFVKLIGSKLSTLT